MTPTVGSLCAGYGGLEMALNLWLGAVDVRWHAEIDPDASRVLKTWWPEVPNLGDFTVPGWAAERVDIEAGGVPCQGFSAAGRQLGAADPRHLWPDWRRGIEARRPDMVVFENVANLTRGKMRPIFDGIIIDLLALGYDVRWCLLGACAVGAAHHRHRVFLLARRTDAMPSVRQVEVQTCGQHAAAYLPTTTTRDASTRGEGSAEFWAARQERIAQKRGRTVADLDAGVTLGAALKLLATPQARDGRPGSPGLNAATAERREQAGRRNLEDSVALLPSPRALDATRGPAAGDRNQTLGRTNGPDLPQVLVNMLPTPKRQDGNNGSTYRNNRGEPGGIAAVDLIDFGKYAEAVARHEAVLGRPAPEPTEIGPRGGRRLAAAFSEWLMMLPAGHLTSVLDRNPALARAGNGVVPLQAATALRLLSADLIRSGHVRNSADEPSTLEDR